MPTVGVVLPGQRTMTSGLCRARNTSTSCAFQASSSVCMSSMLRFSVLVGMVVSWSRVRCNEAAVVGQVGESDYRRRRPQPPDRVSRSSGAVCGGGVVRFLEIFRYELAYRLKSGATWVYAGILFLVAMGMFLALAEEAGHVNAPERIAGLTVIIGMFGMLVTAALFGEAAVRDVEVEMDALLFSSPVGKAEFLGGRFLGSLVVNAVVILAIPLGILAATWIASTGAEEVGPLRLAAHIEPYFTFQLPNLVLVGAVLFTIGMFARQTLPVYLGAIAFFIGYVVMLNYVDRIANPTVATLVDPLGAATLMELTQYWTEAERNTRLVGLPTALAWNRALWLGVSAAVLALLFGTFRFAHVEEGGRHRRRRAVAPALPTERSWPVNVPRAQGSFGPWSATRQTVADARTGPAGAVSAGWSSLFRPAAAALTLLWGWTVARRSSTRPPGR